MPTGREDIQARALTRMYTVVRARVRACVCVLVFPVCVGVRVFFRHVSARGTSWIERGQRGKGVRAERACACICACAVVRSCMRTRVSSAQVLRALACVAGCLSESTSRGSLTEAHLEMDAMLATG